MSNLFWLTDEQMARLRPYFPKSHGKPRVDDRRVLSGITFIHRNGVRWNDAPKEYGPPKMFSNCWKRWSDRGVFARIMVGLAAEGTDRKAVMFDATYLMAHRTDSSPRLKKGGQVTSTGAIKLVQRINFFLSRAFPTLKNTNDVVNFNQNQRNPEYLPFKFGA